MNQYRSVLEVIKLANLETLVTCTEVSSTWSKAAASEELYQLKCEAEIFGPNSQVSYLSAKVMYESYLKTQTQIVLVAKKRIHYFSCKRKSWSRPVRLNRKITSTGSSAWVLLPDGNILSCGGYNISDHSSLADAYLLMSGGEVVTLAPMNEAKADHTCIFYRNAVYTFVGFGSSRNEKLEISTWPISTNTSWKRIPDRLRSGSEVNPHGHGNSIYLVGRSVVDIFHYEDETYTLLTIPMPWRDYLCGAYHNREILLLNQEKLTMWNLERNEVKVIKTSLKRYIDFRMVASKTFDNSLFVSNLHAGGIHEVNLVTGFANFYQLP